jgi:ElaB/YqjD/DUF883 family membrane-anchored ribosome-binding protein
MASPAEADLKALHEQLRQLRSDFAALATTLKDLAQHGIGEASQRAAAPGERAWDEVGRHAETISREIGEKPIASAFAAFGVGLILGVLFSGRRA